MCELCGIKIYSRLLFVFRKKNTYLLDTSSNKLTKIELVVRFKLRPHDVSINTPISANPLSILLTI